MLELEVAVEKNAGPGVKSFVPSRAGSQDAEEERLHSGDALERSGEGVLERVPQPLKVALLGESTAGKTAICEAFCKQNFTPASKYSMTCGVEVYGKCVSCCGASEEGGTFPGRREERVNLILLDCGGKALYREHLPKYWEELDAVVLVMDLTSPSALETGGSWLELVQPCLHSSFAAQSKRSGIVVGSKADLKEQRLISEAAITAFASQHNLQYFECSVRNSSGFGEPFECLAEEWLGLQAKMGGGEGAAFRGQALRSSAPGRESEGAFHRRSRPH